MQQSWWCGTVARRGLFTVLCSPSQLCSCAMCSQFCAGTMLTQRLYPPPLIQPLPPHPLSSNSSPHISSRRSGPTRHHIFHWEFSTPTNVQFPPKEVLGITALLEHCLQVSGIWKHIEEVKICLLQKCVFGSKSVHPLYSRSGCLLLVCNVFSPLMCPICLA